jgi:hypothetical protein
MQESLVLDLRTGGWFPHKYYSASGGVLGFALVYPLEVPNLLGQQGTRYLFATRPQIDKTSWFIGERATEEAEDRFVDHESVIQSSYFDTGPETLQKPANKKSAPYLMTSMEKTEREVTSEGLTYPSSLAVQARWDWNDTSGNGRFSPAQQVYRFRRSLVNGLGVHDNSETVIQMKTKIIGRGSALVLRFEGANDSKTDFRLLGYTIQWTLKSNI